MNLCHLPISLVISTANSLIKLLDNTWHHGLVPNVGFSQVSPTQVLRQSFIHFWDWTTEAVFWQVLPSASSDPCNQSRVFYFLLHHFIIVQPAMWGLVHSRLQSGPNGFASGAAPLALWCRFYSMMASALGDSTDLWQQPVLGSFNLLTRTWFAFIVLPA